MGTITIYQLLGKELFWSYHLTKVFTRFMDNVDQWIRNRRPSNFLQFINLCYVRVQQSFKSFNIRSIMLSNELMGKNWKHMTPSLVQIFSYSLPLAEEKSFEVWIEDMSPYLSSVGFVGLIYLAFTSAAIKTRKYVPSVQENDVWPKFIYQTVKLNRVSSVRQFQG